MRGARLIDIGEPELQHVNAIGCEYAPGDRVWVNAPEIARGRARGTVKHVETTDHDRREGQYVMRLHLHLVTVTMDAPVHVPRIAYVTGHLLDHERLRRLCDWPGAREIVVPPHALDALQGAREAKGAGSHLDQLEEQREPE